jgi:hypothetical protein
MSNVFIFKVMKYKQLKPYIIVEFTAKFFTLGHKFVLLYRGAYKK